MNGNVASAKPLVSAIVTTHNRKDCLLKAIDSVLSQTYGNIELIVVDDASDDETREVLPNIAREHSFNYVYIEKNESRGGNHARNVGIGLACGDWIAFLDDDDEWLSRKIELQLGEAKRTGFDVVGCERIFVTDSGETKPGRKDLPEGDLSMIILTQMPFTTSTLMVKRNLLLELGGFDESLTHWQEYELEIRLCQKSKVACVHQPLVLYRHFATDKARLTNQLDKWEVAVAKIEEKHAALLASALPSVRRKRKKMIAGDGARRASIVGDKGKVRRYLWQIFTCEPNLVWLLKVILGKNKLKNK